MNEGFFKKLFGGGSKKPSEVDPIPLPGAMMTWTEAGGQKRRVVLDERVMHATRSAVEAAALLETGKVDEALAKAQTAGTTLDQYPGPDDDQVINTADMLGIMFRIFKMNDQAERMFQRAGNALDEQGATDTKKL